MNILQPTFEILEQEPGIKGIYKAIEYPGRICYGSTDKITDDSAEEFVHRLEKSNHGAPMEHGAVYLKFNEDDCLSFQDTCDFYKSNPYSKIKIIEIVRHGELISEAYVSTNYRVLFENDRFNDLEYLCEPGEFHHKRVTVRFTCNIGVSREYNRHRKDSINEESTRYCNYSKDKYGNEISIIKNNNKLNKFDFNNGYRGFVDYCKIIVDNANKYDNSRQGFCDIDYWLFGNEAAEWSYVGLTQFCDWKAQDARDILPLDTKSILVHSAFIEDWKHFFDLRALGTTGAPHPQAKELAEPLMKEFIKKGYIKDEK